MQLKHLITIIGLTCAVTVQAADLKELRIGTDATYEPFEYKSPDGKIIGFEIELANVDKARLVPTF